MELQKLQSSTLSKATVCEPKHMKVCLTHLHLMVIMCTKFSFQCVKNSLLHKPCDTDQPTSHMYDDSYVPPLKLTIAGV